MSDPRTRPITVPAAGPAAAAGTDGEVLVRADGVELLGEVPGSGYRRPPALARRGDGQVVSLTPLVQQVLAAVDGSRTVAEVADAVGEATGRLVAPDDVRQLVDRSLRPLGLLRLADGTEPEVRRANPLLALRFRRVITDGALTRRLTAPFAVLFTPLLVVPVVLAFGAVSFWVLFREGLAAATAQAFSFPGLFLAVVLVTVLSAGFHEFGHAAAARYGGATPRAMGFGFYLFWPAFYTDVTDSYRLGRGGRLRTDLGGLYFNAIVVLLAFGVWWVTGWQAVLLLVATQILQMVRQLSPMLRFDGYHVLADATGVPDLYQRIGPTLKGLLPGRWRSPEATALKAWARAVVTLWVLVVVPLMAVSFLLMVVSLPRLIGTAWASLQRQGGAFGQAVDDGDLLGALARALAVVALLLPLLGIALVVVRLVRRTAVGTWRRTAGRPVRRGLALVAAVALVAGLAWAWWPQDGRYRPVRPYEGGTVLDALPAARSSALADGGVGDGLTIWPGGGSLPTADHPVLALVLTPAAGSSSTGAPTWVFPFDRPLPPGAGDNQALAVNTQDGAVRYSVSFSLVWADGDTAVNRNEAYALASCTGCRTVAVAFQVVLLVGDVDVVVPQNLSAAVNYGCVQCVTYALATQLVVSLPDRLDEQASRDLAAVWDRLRAFGDQIEDVPLSELQDRLTEFEDQIAAIVQRSATGSPAQATSDDAGTTSGRPAASTSAEPEPTGGAAETSGSPSSTGTATDSGTATTDSSADTTTDPSTSAATSSGG